jgi:hypothetical protein
MLNGTSLEAASPGWYTSWQPSGESKIDYTFVSQSLLPLVKTPAANPKDDWADDVRICLTLDVSAVQKNNPEPTI